MMSHQPSNGLPLRPGKEHGIERRGRGRPVGPTYQVETSWGSSQLAGQRLDGGGLR
jgi:hypothetical protein